jgi:uncharacterized protein
MRAERVRSVMGCIQAALLPSNFKPAMSEPSFTNLDASPRQQDPEERRFFRNSSLPFAFARVCLYLVFAAAISYALFFVTAIFVKVQRSVYDPKGLITGEAIAMAGVLSAAWVMSRLEKRSSGEYGLPWHQAFRKPFWQGTLFGLVEISSVIAAIGACGFYRFGSLAIHGSDLIRWAAFWAIFFVIVGLYEEFTFRGYTQFTLSQGIGFWPAAIVLSLIFGGVHKSNPGETWVGLAGIVLTGLFWCLTLRRTGNLWFAVGMHASFDFGETFLYSVPDSGAVFPGHLSNATLAGPTWLTGGSAGPEASVFDFAMLLIFFYVFDRLYPARPSAELETQVAPLGPAN